MRLTDRKIRSFKPKAKMYKNTDGAGLYLIVKPTGYKVWWFQYRFKGKQKVLTIGPYPAISLAEARKRSIEARAKLVDGFDPSLEKHRKLGKAPIEERLSFGEMAEDWFDKKRQNYSTAHAENVESRMRRIILPALGHLPITEISVQNLYDLLHPIEVKGSYELAHRVFQYIGNIFRFAIKIGKCERDITADMQNMLEPRIGKHHPTITEPLEVGKLLRALHGYEGYFPLSCALKLAPLLFVRPGNLRGAVWSEFNLDGAEWRIPMERMKAKRPHIVPLAHQAVTVLKELKAENRPSQFIFPSVRTLARPISENTINIALRQLGYAKGTFTAHGFRSMASTLLNQMGWNKDWIERQLAHEERNAVRAAYNFADYLPERKLMMQAWADYLDRLRGNLGDSAPLPITPMSIGL